MKNIRKLIHLNYSPEIMHFYGYFWKILKVTSLGIRFFWLVKAWAGTSALRGLERIAVPNFFMQWKKTVEVFLINQSLKKLSKNQIYYTRSQLVVRSFEGKNIKINNNIIKFTLNQFRQDYWKSFIYCLDSGPRRFFRLKNLWNIFLFLGWTLNRQSLTNSQDP